MVFFAPLIGAATLFAGYAAAAPRPRPDSAIGGEVAVSAPNGIIMSDTAELASNYATATAAMSSDMSYPAATTAAYASAMTSYAASSSSSAADVMSTSSVMAYDTTSSAMAYDTTSSVMAYDTTSTAYSSMQTYGSGSTNWGSSGYNDCISQCIASFGSAPPTYTPPPSSSSGSSSGSGTTHTIIVAPTQGVLRYVPPFINANPGDTVHFHWNANNHTVTKSSALELCNKTSESPVFASGEHNMGFDFDQVVNDTNPVFFYCGTPGHCQKGMFGGVNVGNGDGNTTVDSMMPSMVSSYPSVSAMMSYANNLNGSSAANSWGGNISMSSFPDWSHQYVMENVLYTRALLAMNPDTLKADGTVDMSAGGNPIKLPQDLASVMNMPANNAASGSAATSASSTAAPASSATDSSSASATPTGKANGAGHVAASSALAGLAAIAVTLFAL